MGDLSKLKIGIGQVEIVEGQPSRNEAACDRMVERALDVSADALVVPNSLTDESDVRIIGLNDSRIDVAGNVVVLDACGETYRIGIGRACEGCDFSIVADLRPYTVLPDERMLPARSIVVRPVGMREEGKKVLAFDGGSSVVDGTGQVTMRLRDDFQEEFRLVDFSAAPESEPAAQTLPPGEQLLECLVQTIRRFDAYVLPFGPKWIVGLSGGLDSSITASLLSLALGPERVVGYNMATRYNSEATKSNAAQLASALGIALRNGVIEDLVVSLGNTLLQYGYGTDVLKGVILENVQARTRGNLLSTFAAIENGVVVNNGNRVECALGYATLYGDAIGALAPIGDLTKVQLFDLARRVNERTGSEVVPSNLLPTQTERGLVWETPPSAELANGQRDPMKWFYHDWLVSRLLGDGLLRPRSLDAACCDIMQNYLDTRLADTEAGPWVGYYGLDDPQAFLADLQWVAGSISRASFKRIQAPPAITIASRASVCARPDSQMPKEPSTRYNVLVRTIMGMK